jgi:hypothetical protein
MIERIDAKMNFSDKDKTILSVNHNYYVRTAIATLADMFLTLLIICGIVALVTFICIMIVVSNEGSDSAVKTNAMVLTAMVTLDVLLGIFYFVYVIVKIARVSTMRKHVNRLEKAVIKNCTVGASEEQEQAPEAPQAA